MLEGDEHSPLSLELFLLGGFPLAARVPVNLQQKLEAALEILQLSAACSLPSQGAHCSLQNFRGMDCVLPFLALWMPQNRHGLKCSEDSGYVYTRNTTAGQVQLPHSRTVV